MLRARRQLHKHDLRVDRLRVSVRRLLRRVGAGIHHEETDRLWLLRLPGKMRSLPWIADAGAGAGTSAALQLDRFRRLRELLPGVLQAVH